jgi:hypothetical protein
LANKDQQQQQDGERQQQQKEELESTALIAGKGLQAGDREVPHAVDGQTTQPQPAAVSATAAREKGQGQGREQAGGFRWPLFRMEGSQGKATAGPEVTEATSAASSPGPGAVGSLTTAACGGSADGVGSHWLAAVLEGWRGAEVMGAELQVRSMGSV